MTQIKTVHLEPPSLAGITGLIKSHRFKTPAGYSDAEFAEERKNLISFLQEYTGVTFKDKIVMTGHQPVFFHPGLLFKDLILARAAEESGATPVHLVVDTDQVGMEFKIPFKKESWPDIRTYPFHAREHNIFGKTRATERDRELLSEIYDRIGHSDCFIPETKKEKCRNIVAGLKDTCTTAKHFQEVPEKMRLDYLAQKHPGIINIPVSVLVQSPTFKNFVEKIRTGLDDFRDQHNSHLFEYRMLRKIKNQAQPVPGLKHNEMPFWVVDEEGNRSHMFRDTPNSDIIPRAITLTLFLRIFLADLFIHGVGGGRYEQIAAKLLHSFFNIPGAPFIVASITMNLDKSGCFPEHIPDARDLHNLERKYSHSPEKLSPQLPAAIEKMQLVEMFKNTSGPRRNIHKQIIALNEKIRDGMPGIKSEIEELKNNMPLYDRLRKIQKARDLPFIFYNMDEMENYCKNLR